MILNMCLVICNDKWYTTKSFSKNLKCMGKKIERELRGRMISLEELEEWKKKRDAVTKIEYRI